MLAKTSLECKNLAHNIIGYDHTRWKEVAKEQCAKGITAKFLQNPLLQKMLLETGDKVIVECCKDQVWGTGVPLHDGKCLDELLWSNQGIMGEILEQICHNICCSEDSAPASSSVEPVSVDPNVAGAISMEVAEPMVPDNQSQEGD